MAFCTRERPRDVVSHNRISWHRHDGRADGPRSLARGVGCACLEPERGKSRSAGNGWRGGETGVFERAKKTLAVMGRSTQVGPSGSRQLAKPANRGIVAITIGAAAEAMLLLQKGGADPAAVRDALKGGFADSTILQLYGARITDNDFAPRGRAAIQLKDLDHIVAEARALGLALPMTVDMQRRYERLCTEMGAAD